MGCDWSSDVCCSDLGYSHLDRLEAAGVRWHIAKDVFQRHVTGSDRGALRDVHRADGGARCAGEVEHQPIALDREIERNLNRLVDRPIVVEEIVDGMGSIGQRSPDASEEGRCACRAWRPEPRMRRPGVRWRC